MKSQRFESGRWDSSTGDDQRLFEMSRPSIQQRVQHSDAVAESLHFVFSFKHPPSSDVHWWEMTQKTNWDDQFQSHTAGSSVSPCRLLLFHPLVSVSLSSRRRFPINPFVSCWRSQWPLMDSPDPSSPLLIFNITALVFLRASADWVTRPVSFLMLFHLRIYFYAKKGCQVKKKIDQKKKKQDAVKAAFSSRNQTKKPSHIFSFSSPSELKTDCCVVTNAGKTLQEQIILNWLSCANISQAAILRIHTPRLNIYCDQAFSEIWPPCLCNAG